MISRRGSWLAIGIVLVTLAGGTVPAVEVADDPRPSEDELRAIEQRGLLLQRLDGAATVSTDAMTARGLELDPQTGLYLCYEQGEVIRCAFGTIAPGDATYALEYLFEVEGDVARFVEGRPGRRERRRLTALATATRKAGALFPFNREAEGYNHIVVPEDDGSISVYFVPATATAGRRVMGSDGVVSVAPDGTTAVTRYHRALLAYDAPEDGSKLAGGAHSHVDLSRPNPLDVRFALGPPSATEYVIGPNWVFEVDKTGSIRCLGETEAFIKELRGSLEEDVAVED